MASVKSEHDKWFIIGPLLNHMHVIILLRLCEKKWSNIYRMYRANVEMSKTKLETIESVSDWKISAESE